MSKQKISAWLVLPVFLLMIGCDDNSNPAGGGNTSLDNNLIGEWQIEKKTTSGIDSPLSADYTEEYLFNGDGTYEYTLTGNNGHSGNWRVSGDSVYMDGYGQEYGVPYNFENSMLVITVSVSESFFTKTGNGGSGNGSTGNLVGTWNCYKAEIEDEDGNKILLTSNDPMWEVFGLEITFTFSSTTVTQPFDGEEIESSYTYEDGVVTIENDEYGSSSGTVTFESSDEIIIDIDGEKLYFERQ